MSIVVSWFPACTMFPLLFIPGSGECAAATSGQQLATCYDLRCSEEFGCGASNVTIQQVKVGWRTLESVVI